jgi:hypothetical protein
MPAISQDDYLKDTSQFDVARKRVQEQSASNLQSRKDALARRFAALGNLEGGARLKIEQKVADEESQNLARANEGVDAAQNAELGRRREVIQGQQFATSEREGNQKFAGEQSAMQRAWGTGEREAGQKFAVGEREAGQTYASGEAEKQRAVQQTQFDKQYGLATDQFAASKEQFEKTYQLEQKTTEANMRLQEKLANEKGLFEGIGAGGTNIWKGIQGGGKGLVAAVSSAPNTVVNSIKGLF